MSAGELWLTGGTAVTMDARLGVVANATIHVRDGRIVSLAPGAAAPAGARSVDCRGCLVLPGLVNGHTHIGMTLFRGIADDLPLERFLHERIFPFEARWNSAELIGDASRLAAVEMIRGGTTTLNNMDYFQESVAAAVDSAGLRGLCGPTIIDIGGKAKPEDQVFAELDAFRSGVSGYRLVTPVLAPHSEYGLSGGMWKRVAEYARKHGLRLHLHLSETEAEVADSRRRHGVSPVRYFEELGVWQSPATAAHGVCLDEDDIALLARRGVGVVHNPGSNLKLGNRISPVVRLRRAGVRVGLGTDGAASNNNLDLFEEATLAALAQAHAGGAGALTAEDAVRLLTIEGAAALGLEQEIGSIEPGKQADLIALDVTRPHAIPMPNVYSHVVYAAGAQDVKHTVVAGRVLMEAGKLLTLDESAVLARSREWANRLHN